VPHLGQREQQSRNLILIAVVERPLEVRDGPCNFRPRVAAIRAAAPVRVPVQLDELLEGALEANGEQVVCRPRRAEFCCLGTDGSRRVPCLDLVRRQNAEPLERLRGNVPP